MIMGSGLLLDRLYGKEKVLASVFDAPIYSSDQSLDRVLNAGLPVLLVFASGSLPSALDSTLKSLAKQEAGSLLVVQADWKDSQATAERFGVAHAPALVTIKGGQKVSQSAGLDGAALESHARYLLGKGPRPEKRGERPNMQAAPGYTAPRRPQYHPADPGSNGSGAAGGAPVVVTDSTFEQEVMRSTLPVIVDFWAPWCGPCRMVAPILDKLAREWNGKVKIVKVNVDENQGSSGRFGVQAIPTMLVVKDGRVVDQWAGALPEPNMRARLARHMR
jgi:thioredoxin 1